MWRNMACFEMYSGNEHFGNIGKGQRTTAKTMVPGGSI